MLKAKFVTAPLLVLSAVTLVACSHKDDSKDRAKGPAPVGYIVVHTQPVQVTQELAGRTSAWLVADVRPQVTGIVKSRLFTEGGAVKAGQSLYQIDPATYQAAYDSALAAEQQAQASYDLAQTNAQRAQQLITVKAISQADFDAEALVPQINRAAAEITREVAERYSARDGKHRWVAGALGPTNKTLSLSPNVNDPAFREVDFDQVKAVYREQIDALVEGGVDFILIETIFDTLNAKAAIMAALDRAAA